MILEYMSERCNNWQTKVLDMLQRRREPLSAYDILGELRTAHPKIAPPTVYRALTALTERGQVHRIESLNAFVACQCKTHLQASVLSVCDTCGVVEENLAPDLLNALNKVATRTGFVANRQVIELHGVCAACGKREARA